MRKNFIQVQGENFVLNGEKIILRGFAAGTWMNIEHFMVGLPGTDGMIKDAFKEVYGEEKGNEFINKFIDEFITEGDIEYFTKMGVNSIRIPFSYQFFIDDHEPNHIKEDGFKKLDKVINLCKQYKIYAILDLHTVPGGQNPDWHSGNITGQPLFWNHRCFKEQIINLWQEIAKRYSDEEWIAGYDLLNEPSYNLSAEEFNGFYDETIAAVREYDKDHIFFLEGDDFGRSFELFHEPQDPQIAYALHYYPFVIDADVLDPNMTEDKRKAFFEKVFYRQLRARERFHRPLWCGEAGLEYLKDQLPLYKTMLGYIIDMCESNNISWSLWTYKDAQVMGVVRPKDDSKWMELFARIGESWSHHGEMEKSRQALKDIVSRYFSPISEDLFYDVEFRMRSIFHKLAVETVLKEVLRTIPFDEIIKYPESFRFENCDKLEEITDFITEYINNR